MSRSANRKMALVVSLCFSGAIMQALALDTAANDQDSKRIQGKWSISSAELAGDPLPAELFKKMTLILEKDKYTLKSASPDDIGTTSIDDSKQPRQLDIKGIEGPNKGKTMLAIYELEGDTLKVCYDLEGKSRPMEFKTEKGSKQFLAVYKRVKE